MTPEQLTQEQLDLLRARDVRIRALDHALLVEQELRESRTLNLVLASIEQDVGEAMEQFADANPADLQAISNLQARVHRLVYLRRTIAFVSDSGKHAAEALQSDDINPTFDE